MRGAALFLDLDGTIAEIAARPGDVGPDARRASVLGALNVAMAGRVAVLTGRPLEEVDRILDGLVTSVAAVHGLVRRFPDGAVAGVAASPKLLRVKRFLRILAERRRGLIVEDKGQSVAVHYRLAPAAEAAVRKATRRLARADGLVVQNGSMVSEVRTAGPDKGDSLKAFLQIQPFAGCTPIMVGDDLTDEHAFAAAEEMGGYGILVGLPRPSAARYGLASVADVLRWLDTGVRP